MARRRRAVKRDMLPDPKFRSVLVAKFINNMMRGGKKSVAEQILYNALDTIGEQSGEDALDVFQKALDNVKPSVEVRSRRVGGSTYQIPTEVPPDRKSVV